MKLTSWSGLKVINPVEGRRSTSSPGETDHVTCIVPNNPCFLSTAMVATSAAPGLLSPVKEHKIQYFFAYKMEFLSFQNNSKNLDPSYKMDPDLWDCFGRVKLILQQNCIRLIWLFILILERGKPCLLAE